MTGLEPMTMNMFTLTYTTIELWSINLETRLKVTFYKFVYFVNVKKQLKVVN